MAPCGALIVAANGYEGVKEEEWPGKKSIPHVSWHHHWRFNVEKIMARNGIDRESIFYITLVRDLIDRCLFFFYM